MDLNRIIVVTAILAIVSGCASNRPRYTPPSPEQIAAQQRQAEENRKRWQAQQREYQKQQQIQQEKLKQQQQVQVDNLYDSELRQFLRSEGYQNAAALTAASRLRINYFRQNPNPSDDEKSQFFYSQDKITQNNILRFERPEFVELISKFEDEYRNKINRQIAVERQQALRALSSYDIQLQNRPPLPANPIFNGNSNPRPSTNAVFACGFKPFPRLGCRIGRCVNGQWEQVCG